MGHWFWEGFEKQAASLIGSMPGITSGLRNYSKAGVLRTARPVSGQVIGPRSTPALIPGPTLVSAQRSAGGIPVFKKPPQKIPALK